MCVYYHDMCGSWGMHVYMHIGMCVSMYVRICVGVCMGRGADWLPEAVGGDTRDRGVCMYVCMYVCVCVKYL